VTHEEARQERDDIKAVWDAMDASARQALEDTIVSGSGACGGADHASQRSGDALFGLASRNFPVSPANFEAVVKCAIPGKPDIGGSRAYCEVLRTGWAEHEFVEDVHAIPTARKFKQEMTCPLAHPGSVAPGVSLVKVLLARNANLGDVYVLKDDQGMQVPFTVALKWRRPPRSVVLALGQLVGGTILELSFKAGGFDFATECAVFKPFFEGRHPPAHIDVYKTEKQCVHDSLVTFGVKFAHEEPVICTSSHSHVAMCISGLLTYSSPCRSHCSMTGAYSVQGSRRGVWDAFEA
jgi:hypothetical protein